MGSTGDAWRARVADIESSSRLIAETASLTIRVAVARRKLDGIAPLHDVFHLLPLVNLVNEFRCVIHQTHRSFPRNAGASEPVDIGDPETVKTKMRFLHLDEELLDFHYDFIHSPLRMKADERKADLAAENSERSSAAFTPTQWTTVLNAQGTSPSSDEALNRLCRKYWPPVYAFIRRKWKQHSPQKAEDLTQGFFTEFIRKFPYLEVSPNKGKFRSYLLACLTRFLCKDWERSPDAHEQFIPPEELEQAAATDSRLSDCAAEHAFDIVWANTLAEKALDSLLEEYSSRNKATLHSKLLPLLTGRSADGAYAAIAAELQMSEGALRVATHQFRRRFGELLRAEVANTVSRIEDTDEELRYLLSLWGKDRSSSEGVS